MYISCSRLKAICSGLKARGSGLFILSLLILINILPVFAAENKTLKLGVSESTPIPIVAEWPIGPDTQEGEHFSARIIEDITSASGELNIPKNSRVVGTVVNIKRAGLFRQGGKVDVRFEKIIFPDNVTSLKIAADGSIEKDKYATIKAVGEMAGEVALGAALGAIGGFKLAGIAGASTSTGSSIAIGAMAGAGLSVISFVSRRGTEVEIYPGMPMTLNIIDMQNQNYKAQKIITDEEVQEIKADILSVAEKRVTVAIENNSENAIPLGNLKIVDALGYTVKPQIGYNYFAQKRIPANSYGKYDLPFSPTRKKTKYWLVLTDSFNKQEYFRKELKVN